MKNEILFVIKPCKLLISLFVWRESIYFLASVTGNGKRKDLNLEM